MLPYDAEALLALLEAYNRGLWPAQLAALALGALALWLAWRPDRAGRRVAAALLAAGWLCTGLVFELGHYATLNWAGWGYAVVFLAEALALLGWGVVRAWPAPRAAGDVARAGLALALVALAANPLLEAALAGSPAGVQLPGLLPDATAVFTIGVLLAARGAPWGLLLAPAAWCGWSALWWWQLGVPARMPLPLLGLAAPVLALELALLRRRA